MQQLVTIRIITIIDLKGAAARGGGTGGVGAEEDEVGQQDRHLGEHLGDHLQDRHMVKYLSRVMI